MHVLGFLRKQPMPYDCYFSLAQKHRPLIWIKATKDDRFADANDRWENRMSCMEGSLTSWSTWHWALGNIS
ncbi:hypothetical protein V6N13_137955 [Hibiscus sabdariffa]